MWCGVTLMTYALAAMLLLAPRSVKACATCECGDPTLVVMGTEQPFAQRVRPSLSLRHRTDAVGRVGINRVELSEQRLELALAYAPLDWLMLSATVPLVRRQLDYTDLSREGFFGIGDSDVRARLFVFRDRDLAPRHLIAVALGLKLPTAPMKTAQAMNMNPELLAGTGSFDPMLGATYSFFADEWSLFVSEMLYVPTRARGLRVGTSWRGMHAIQYQAHELIALRLSAETRWEMRTTYNAQNVSDTGGFILHTTPSIALSPMVDLVVLLAVHIPTINALYGEHDEGAVFELGAALDL